MLHLAAEIISPNLWTYFKKQCTDKALDTTPDIPNTIFKYVSVFSFHSLIVVVRNFIIIGTFQDNFINKIIHWNQIKLPKIWAQDISSFEWLMNSEKTKKTLSTIQIPDEKSLCMLNSLPSQKIAYWMSSLSWNLCISNAVKFRYPLRLSSH